MSFPAGRHRSTGHRVAGSDRLPGLLATVPGRLAGLRGAGATVGPGGSMSHGEDDGDATAWTGQTLRTLAAVFLVTWSFRLAGYLTFGTWVAVPVVLMGLTGLLAFVMAWLPRGTLASRRQHQIGVAVLAAAIIAARIWSYFQVFTAPDYGTDEIAFDQYAAQLALHGINPYLHSMAPAFPLFHVSPNGYTFQLNGQPVTALSYPALAFEAYLPLLAAGVTTQAAVWIEIFSWALGAAHPVRGPAAERGTARGRGGEHRRLHRLRGRRGDRHAVRAAAHRCGRGLGSVRVGPRARGPGAAPSAWAWPWR